MITVRDRNAQLAASFITAMTESRIDELSDMLDRDAVWHVPGRGPMAGEFEGRGRILRHLIDVRQLTGGSLRLEVRDVVPADDVVLAECHATAGPPEAGLDVDEVLVFELNDGRIREIWTYFSDRAAFDAYSLSHSWKEARAG